MNPEKRKIIQVAIEDGLVAERMFKTLMGDDVEKRKDW
ncbi:DNA gyrase, B subunit, partial [Mycoplasma putrefaciens]